MSKPQFNLTVIAGLSGAGKTFTINKILETNDKYVHFSAGTLIGKRRKNISHDELRLLDSNEILQNQHLLIDQLNIEKLATPNDAHILFDAHMIIDTDTDLVEIPYSIFQKLSPSRFIFLEEQPDVILNRRLKDSSRKRPIRTIDEIRSHQERSKTLAQDYSSKLSIKYMNHSSSEFLKLISEIK